MRTSDQLNLIAGEVETARQRLLATTSGDVPGRTSDVKDVALLRLRQAVDVLAEEAVMLERYGE